MERRRDADLQGHQKELRCQLGLLVKRVSMKLTGLKSAATVIEGERA
jgi:hypothetical protein